MAKKRRDLQYRARSTQAQQAAEVVHPAAKTGEPKARAVNLAEEYDYVLTDLRRIGLIAAVMFALLFVLAFALA